MQVPQVGRVLPGPAGKLQELAAAGALQQATPQTLGLQPGTITGISPSQAATQLDAAFLSSSWGAAEARADEDAVAAGPVRSIKYAKEMGVGKVPRMLLLLSTFHPSGAGSAFSKVKDPSGIMGAAIHSSALQHQQQLGPGCVLLVQNVSVLTPNPGSSYLAVTADNIVQVWGPGQASRNIRHTTHQPARGATQQQQQQPGQQQQQPQQQAAGQQQQQGLFRWAPPGQQQQQQRAGAAAAAAVSGGDSRQTSSFFPPPSPDIMSVLNQMSRAGPGAAAADTRQQGAPGTIGMHQSQQQGLQQQQQQQSQQQSQHGAFSPALSGAASRQQQQQHSQVQQQQRAGPGSMAPPPPRAPAGPSQQQQQQQQQMGAGHRPLHRTLMQDAGTFRAPRLQQQGWGQQQQQQPLHGHNPQQQTQGQRPGQAAGTALFKGLSQSTNADTHTVASVPAIGRSPAASQGPAGASSQGLGALPSMQFNTATNTMSQPSRPPARLQQAPALCDDDEDVEVDENIVAAIFGSQVPKPVAPLVPPQPQNLQQSLHGAAVSVLGQHTSSVLSNRSLTQPGAVGVVQQQSSQAASANSPAVVAPGSGQLTGAGESTAKTTCLGNMRPPTAPLRPTQPELQQQQQQWGLQGSRQQPSGAMFGKQIGSLGGSVLGKRPAAVSLLDDLVSGDLDDL